MNFLISAVSDVGIKRKNNQDSLSVMVADTDFGKVLFAIVCDGMGGLSKGELASATLIRAFNDWFKNDFQAILYKKYNRKRLFEVLKKSWNNIIQQQNTKIKNYGMENNIQLGSTLSLLLCFDDKYYIVHVGDTRIYILSDSIVQLTKDQTLLQREIGNNNLTSEEIANFPRKNVLLQCIGVNDVLPSFYTGDINSNCSFLLCSDGFRHKISEAEIFDTLKYENLISEDIMQNLLLDLTDMNKNRLEKDNISSIVIRVTK